MIVWMRRA